MLDRSYVLACSRNSCLTPLTSVYSIDESSTSDVLILAVSIALGLYLSKISAPDPDTDKDSTETVASENKYDSYNKIKTEPVGALPMPETA